MLLRLLFPKFKIFDGIAGCEPCGYDGCRYGSNQYEDNAPNAFAFVLLHQPDEESDEGNCEDAEKKPTGSCHDAKVGKLW